MSNFRISMVLLAMIFCFSYTQLSFGLSVEELEKLGRSEMEDDIIESMLSLDAQRIELDTPQWIRLGQSGLSERILLQLVDVYSHTSQSLTVDDIIQLRDAGLKPSIINAMILSESQQDTPAAPTGERVQKRLLLQNKTDLNLHVSWDETKQLLRIRKAKKNDEENRINVKSVLYVDIPDAAFMILWEASAEIFSVPQSRRSSFRLELSVKKTRSEKSYWAKLFNGQRDVRTWQLAVETLEKQASEFDLFNTSRYTPNTGRYLKTGEADPEHDLILWANRQVLNAPETWRSKYYDSFYPIAPKRALHNYDFDYPIFWTRDTNGRSRYYYGKFPNQNYNAYVPVTRNSLWPNSSYGYRSDGKSND